MDKAASGDPATGSVTSRDGTRIGYRRYGRGAAVILLHGAGQSSSNFIRLAKRLARDFTVHVPDRRGRGLSGRLDAADGLERQCEDLAAVIDATSATRVFGLSAGAVIALETARLHRTIEKLALYEPPLPAAGFIPGSDWGPGFLRAADAGRNHEAFMRIYKGAADPYPFGALPPLLLQPLLGLALALRLRPPSGDATLAELIASVRNDLRLPEQAGPASGFAGVVADVLLMGGERSHPYLTTAVDELEAALPHATRIHFRGTGHLAADNTGRPGLVARALRRFFDAPR